MSEEYEWTCAGCGIPSPNKMRSCDCATNVVCWDRKREWKRDPTTADANWLADELTRLGHAETEKQFFDFVSEALPQIISALRKAASR